MANSKDINVFHIVEAKLNNSFDEIVNCDVTKRFSDIGFTDRARMMIRPRPGIQTVSQSLGDVNGELYWFTDNDGNRSGYISRDGEAYKFDFSGRSRFVGYFCDKKEREEKLNSFTDGDYFIVHQTLYKYQGGGISTIPYTWSDCYDNEADLWAKYPDPVDGLFAFLKDTQSVYYSSGGEWLPYNEFHTLNSISLGNSGEYPACFNTVTLPKDFQISGISPTVSTTTNTVTTNLASPEQYVGSYIFIKSGTYKGKYGYIFDYEATTSEFIIVSIDNAVALPAGVEYDIYETKGRYLQITNGKDPDKYWDGTQFATQYEGFIQDHLGLFATFPNGGPGCIVTFGNQSYTSIDDTVYVSDVSQPLWFNINDIIDLQQSSPVTSLYVWRNRVVAAGSNFSTFINPDPTSGINRTTDFSQNYGVVPGSMTQVLSDFWFLTTSGEIVSMSENYTGGITAKNDIGIPVESYLKTFKTNVVSGFDGRKFYIYGEEYDTEGYTCVFDTLYQYWGVYTGLRPASFFFEYGVMYFVDKDTGELKQFVEGKVTDGKEKIDQYISSRDHDLGDVFRTKQLANIFLYFENKNSEVEMTNYMMTNDDAFCKRYTKRLYEKKPSDYNLADAGCKACFKNNVGSNVLGFNNICTPEIVPKFWELKYSNDKAYIHRWKLRSIGNNGFYLNQIKVQYRVSSDDADGVEF